MTIRITALTLFAGLALLSSSGTWAADPAKTKSSANPKAAAADAAPVNGAPADAAPTSTAAPADTGDARMPEIEAAEALLKAGDFDGARTKLAEAQKKNAHLAAPGVVIARWQMANGQMAPARAELEQVITTVPGDPEPFAILGELDWREGRMAESDLLFHAALLRARSIKDRERRSNVEIQAHAGLAAVAESRNRWQTARDELLAWVALDGENAAPHQRLGYALFRLSQPEEAQKEFQKAADGNKDFVPELAMATLYDEAGDHEAALKASSAALKRLPKSVGLRLAIANRDLEHNRIAEAKSLVDEALKLDPESLESKILAGGIGRLEHQLPTAERYLESAQAQSPTSFAASNLLALTLADQKDQTKRARALEFAEQNVQTYPQHSEAIATLGWVYFQLERYDEASQMLKRALGTGTLNADGAYFAAKMFQREGKSDEVKTLLTKALATGRRFAYQDDAEKLLAALNKPAQKPAAQPAAPAKQPKKAR